MKKIKKILIFLGLIIISAFLVSASIFVFSEILFKHTQDTLSPATSAFLGAFFAFLFLRVSEFLSVHFQKIRNHHNALIKLQFACNEYFNVISDNISFLENFANFVENTKNTNIIPVYMNRFHEFETNKSVLLKFQDIDLINRVFSFQDDLRRANSDMSTFTRFYNEMRQGILQGNITKEEYIYNIKNMLKEFKKLKQFFRYIEDQSERMFAITKHLLKSRFLKIFYKVNFPSEETMQKMIAELRIERDQCRKESKQEKEAIFSK